MLRQVALNWETTAYFSLEHFRNHTKCMEHHWKCFLTRVITRFCVHWTKIVSDTRVITLHHHQIPFLFIYDFFKHVNKKQYVFSSIYAHNLGYL